MPRLPLQTHSPFSRRQAALLGLSALLSAATAPGFAASGKRPASRKSPGRGKPAAPPSSEESRADRERRLSRECRGRANAGACLGYGQ
ncbi:MAG: hypothetical protein EKK45_02620 [Curvibacter sp.]|nr:MAG: hypothetical protein EKK45_02620 [Curvibacter sp.]